MASVMECYFETAQLYIIPKVTGLSRGIVYDTTEPEQSSDLC